MKTSIINWFRISNWHELRLQYRLVDVSIDGAGNDGKQYNKAFFNALNHLAYSTKGPVSQAYHDGKRFIAVKHDANLKEATIPGSPLNVKLTPVAGVFTLTPREMCPENLDLAIRFLESALKYQFNKNTNLWDGGNNTFLKKTPLRQSSEIQTDIYHGFKFRVVAEDKENVFICVDLAYKYADKYTLHEVLKQLPKERHNDYVNGKNFLYLNGDDWYTVKGKSIGVTIEKHLMSINGKNTSVYNYISNEGKYANARFKAPLIRNSETFFHAYAHNSTNAYAGAACLAKAIHTADNDLHKLSINDPNNRFMRAEYHVKNYFQNLQFNDVRLQVHTKPYEKEAKVFRLPSLKFGNGVILDPYNGQVKYGAPVDHFPKRRREFVYNNGILTDSAFTPQYLFVPDNMPFSFAKSVKFYFDRLLKQIAPNFPGFIIHQYSMRAYPFANKVYLDLKKDVESKQLAGGNALVILPESKGRGDMFNKFFHNIIKKEFFESMKIKCVSARSLQRYLKPGADKFGNQIYFVPDSLMRDFKSYQANTLFEHLIINRKWPYALAENLHYDLYIGIDAHDFYAGFVFFFKNGEKIVFDTEKVVKSIGSFRNEKISYKVIEDKIVAVLSRHITVGEDVPKSIVILRDGVSYGEEEKALIGALKRLTEAKLLDGCNIQTGVIDVAKSSAIPVRAADFTGVSNSLENPASGTHFYMNNNDAFIFNTGAPYKVPGSSNPIHVSFTAGDIDFSKALEDIFRLTQITFSSPDRPTSLPLPLKLIDTLIRDVAHEYDFVTTQDKETKIHEPSLN